MALDARATCQKAKGIGICEASASDMQGAQAMMEAMFAQGASNIQRAKEIGTQAPNPPTWRARRLPALAVVVSMSALHRRALRDTNVRDTNKIAKQRDGEEEGASDRRGALDRCET